MAERDSGEVFDRIADSFDATRYKPWPETVEFLDSLPRGAFVLDVGCGNGRNAVYAEKARLRVVAFDISLGMLVKAKGKTSATSYALADAGAVPFGDGRFDAVIAVAIVHHIETAEGRQRALREIGRVLKPGGKALIGVWAREQERLGGKHDGKGDAWVDWKLPHGAVEKRFYHLYTEEEFRGALASAGLVEERYFFRCDNHYAIVTGQP